MTARYESLDEDVAEQAVQQALRHGPAKGVTLAWTIVEALNNQGVVLCHETFSGTAAETARGDAAGGADTDSPTSATDQFGLPAMYREDPPPRGSRIPADEGHRRAGVAARYIAGLATLRDHPGKWHRYDQTVDASYMGRTNAGRFPGIEPGEFEATGRSTESRKWDIWVRYVGGQDA